MSDLRERLAEAIERGLLVGPEDGAEGADAILAADPALARRYELGCHFDGEPSKEATEALAAIVADDPPEGPMVTNKWALLTLRALAARLREGA